MAAVAVALGMFVIISTRTLPLAAPPAGVQYTTSVDELLQRSDFVSIHCPLNTEVQDYCGCISCYILYSYDLRVVFFFFHIEEEFDRFSSLADNEAQCLPN